MQSPLSYHLARVDWQLYVTLTFGSNWTAKKTRNKTERVFAWIREVVEFHTGERVLGDIPFVIAEELGDMNDRFHIHMLIGGLPKLPTKGDCFAMSWTWQERFRGGHAKIRPYDASLGGVRYVIKSLSLVDLRSISSEERQNKAQALAGVHVGHATTFAGANAYELAKIGKQDGQELKVTLSLGLQRLLQSRANPRRSAARSVAFFRR